jgi:hypothetical protein
MKVFSKYYSFQVFGSNKLQQMHELRSNKLATSQQYFSLRINQHQPNEQTTIGNEQAEKLQ